MKVPPPNLLIPFVVGLVATFLIHPGGEASSFRGAAWSLIQLGLIAMPFMAALNLLAKEKKSFAGLAAWVGAALAYVALV